MKRKYKNIDDDANVDIGPLTKHQRLDESQTSYPIKMVILGNTENNNLSQYLPSFQAHSNNNSKHPFKNIPVIYSSLHSKNQGLIRKACNQKFALLNMHTTIKHQKNVNITTHWMELQDLLHSELIQRRHYKPFSTILNGSSVLIYYIDIRDQFIEFIRNTNYNPQRMASNTKFSDNDHVNIIWKYWMLNKLIFGLSICNLSSPKQLFIIFTGLQNDEIQQELIRRKSNFIQENYAEIIQTTIKNTENSSQSSDQISHHRNIWLNNAKDYIQNVLFKQCGWNKHKDNVKLLLHPKLMKGQQAQNQQIMNKFYQNHIFDHIIIPKNILFESSKNHNHRFMIQDEIFRMIVQESFIQSKSRYLIITGYIIKGTIQISQQCTMFPFKQDFIIRSIQTLNGKSLKSASIGQSVGICTDIQINYQQYTIPRLITDTKTNNFKECGIDFKYCYISGVFHWNPCSEMDNDIQISRQLLLNICNQRSIAQIVGIQLSYTTSPILKSIHHSLVLYDDDNNNDYNQSKFHQQSLLRIETLILSFIYRVNNDNYCDDPFIVSIKSSLNPINVCIKPLCDLTGIVIDQTTKPFNQCLLLSHSQIVAKCKVLKLLNK